MKYLVDWVEAKGKDWKLATLLEGQTKLEDVSINRTSKKGETFPGFDDIGPGTETEGELWTSASGKKYLFPPRAEKAGFAPRNGSGIKAAQERKAEMIEKAQDRKTESIAYFNSINCAIELVSKMNLLSKENIKEMIVYYRDWFLSEYRKYEKSEHTEKHDAF